MLLKGVGARSGGSGSTSAGARVARAYAHEAGFHARVVDGSGLSRGNSVAPRDVGRLLLAARKQAWFDAFYRSLPLAGVSGTLHDRMHGTARRRPLPRQDRHARRSQRAGRLLPRSRRGPDRLRDPDERRQRVAGPPGAGPHRVTARVVHRPLGTATANPRRAAARARPRRSRGGPAPALWPPSSPGPHQRPRSRSCFDTDPVTLPPAAVDAFGRLVARHARQRPRQHESLVLSRARPEPHPPIRLRIGGHFPCAGRHRAARRSACGCAARRASP